MFKQIEQSIALLKKTKPLVLCLTNYVTMDFVANSLLACGAAPIMSNDEREFEELIKISSAVYINIGTLNEAFVKQCEAAVVIAKKYKKPIVLDPVGAGASAIRTAAAKTLAVHANIIRGNASEILALAGDASNTRGVEATNSIDDAREFAESLARALNCVVVISGAEDFITDGSKNQSLKFGSDLMPLVTGMGCALTGVIAAFAGSMGDTFDAAVSGAAYFSLCGSAAHTTCKGPGEFKVKFLDALYVGELSYERS